MAFPVGLAIGIAGGIGKMFGRGAANRKMRRLMKNDPVYQENPLAKQRLGLAQTLLNARMPGAVAAEQNLKANQASHISNINRGATDASQALLLGADAIGNTNEAINELGMEEAQDYQRRYGNLVQGQEGVINEQDKVFNDRVRRFQNQVQLGGAINENQQNNWGDISNLGFGLQSFFGDIGGGGSGGTLPAGYNTAVAKPSARSVFTPPTLNYPNR